MSDTIYYVRLIGIKAKETKLIESFLSIASEDGLIVKVDYENKHVPTTVFVDELFHSDSLTSEYPDSSILIMGDDHNYKADDYLNRPLKWSVFQEILDTLIISRAEKKAYGLSVQELTEYADSASGSFQEPGQYDAEDYDSSQYEVSEFEVSKFADTQGFSLSNDSSVLSQESEFSEVQTSFSEMGTVIEDEMEVVEMAHSRVIAERALFEGGGLVLGPNIVFWENFDCLMTVKSRPVLYILSSTGSVYSEYGYLDWTLLLKSKYDIRAVLGRRGKGASTEYKIKSRGRNGFVWTAAKDLPDVVRTAYDMAARERAMQIVEKMSEQYGSSEVSGASVNTQ